jgi:formiminotetrahydrofolate cyclodeaminase
MVARVTMARGARGAVRGASGSARDGQGAAAVTAARVARSADRLRRRLTLLIARDADAFGAVLAARKWGGASLAPSHASPGKRLGSAGKAGARTEANHCARRAPTEAIRRTAPSRSHARGALGSARVQRALRAATEVPLEVARKSADVLALGAALVPRARLSTLADLGTAAALACAALEAGALTARANLEDLEDRAFVTRSARELERLSAAGARVRGRLARALAARWRREPSAKRRGGPAAA